MSHDQDAAQSPRPSPNKPGVWPFGWRLATYVVNDTLGISSVRPGTLVSAFLTAVLGLPLIASATEKLVSGIVAQWLGKPDELLPAALTFALLATAFSIVLIITLHRWRHDLWNPGSNPALTAKSALILPCSLPPDADWMRALTGMNPQERLKRAGTPPGRWLELLVRALEIHGRILERVTLLFDPEAYDDDQRTALRELVAETVRRAEQRTVSDLDILLTPLDDANDAEAVRAIASGELQRLRELDLAPTEIGIQVTTGTSAMTIGLALAATIHRIEVQYFPQKQDPGPETDVAGIGSIRGVRGPVPMRVHTSRARLRLEEALRQSA